MNGNKYVRFFETIGSGDVGVVGGKNANLGEMIVNLKAKGIPVPEGFAATSEAYWEFIRHGDLQGKIGKLIAEYKRKKKDPRALDRAGAAIRQLFLTTEMPDSVTHAAQTGLPRIE